MVELAGELGTQPQHRLNRISGCQQARDPEFGGEEGIGEDVTYTADDHPPPGDLPLAGSHTLDTYSRLLDGLELFPRKPEMDASSDYRRWAFESAALDLALRQQWRALVQLPIERMRRG